MQNYAKVGGILSIVSGSFAVVYLLGTMFFMMVFSVTYVESGFYHDDIWWSDSFPGFFVIFIVILGGYVMLGALALTGGIFTLKKRYWGWALAGSIAGTITFWPCGIPAIVFTALAKPEFELVNTPSVESQT